MKDFILYIFYSDKLIEILSKDLKSEDNFIVVNKNKYDIKNDIKLPILKKNKIWYTSNSSETLLKSGEIIRFKDESKNEINILPIDLNNINLSYKKFLLDKQRITIGRLESNDISINLQNLVSRNNHAVVEISNDKAYIEDLSNSLIGVYVNNKKVIKKDLKLGDEIFIAGVKIVYLKQFIAVSDNYSFIKLNTFNIDNMALTYESETDTENYEYVERTPRIKKDLNKNVINIEAPPALKTNSTNYIDTLVSFTPMIIVSIVSLLLVQNDSKYAIISFISVAISIIGQVGLTIYNNNKIKKENDYIISRYNEYLQEKRDKLYKLSEENRIILNEKMFPSPEEIIKLLKNKERLWEKSVKDEDFLEVRVGTGNRSSELTINVPSDTFEIYEQELKNEARLLEGEFSTVDNAPITIDFKKDTVVGIYGNTSNIESYIKNITLNIVGLHLYTDVKLVYIHNTSQTGKFQWLNEIPHIWNDEKTVRYVGTNIEEVNVIFNDIKNNLEYVSKTKSTKYIIFIEDDKLLKNQFITRLIEDNDNNNFIGIYYSERLRYLSKECSVIIETIDNEDQIYYKAEDKLVSIVRDKIDYKNTQKFMQGISKLYTDMNLANTSIPESVSFLDMYQVGNSDDLDILKRWNESQTYNSIKIPIGVGKNNELFNLDIHENSHGCHGLIAGMTGAGKSELLQSLILSLAINYHPHDLSFILIDYKGGGSSNLFKGIPHVSGSITNLSGANLKRYLKAISVEMNKRQQLFNKYEVNHIDKYQKMYKQNKVNTPLPHLVIVCDEFAQLKNKEYEFLQEIVNISQIGRSLGIHLILATQKPSGVVTDQIWSNSRFKICLKVLSNEDSNEVIRNTDAAKIKLTGRCIVQVGYDEIYETIQSAYSGANYYESKTYIDKKDKEVKLISEAGTDINTYLYRDYFENKNKTQLEEVVDKIREVANTNNINKVKIFSQPLKETIYLDEIEYTNKQNSLNVCIGLGDIINTQEHIPVELDIEKHSNLVIYGKELSGKTTLLQNIVLEMCKNCSPEELNIYVLDLEDRYLGSLKELVHCSEFITSNDKSLDIFFEYILNLINIRNNKFKEHKVSSIEEYRKVGKETIASIVIVIDEAKTISDNYTMSKNLEEILSKCKRYGIYVIVTASSQKSIQYNIRHYISNYICLNLNDDNEYRDILNSKNHISIEDIKGRGVIKIDGVATEFQAALIRPRNNSIDRRELIKIEIEQINDKYKDIQKKIVLENIKDRERDNISSKDTQFDWINIDNLFIGYSYENPNILKSYINQINKLNNTSIVLFDNEDIDTSYSDVEISNIIRCGNEFDKYMSELSQIIKNRKLIDDISKEKDIYIFINKLDSLSNILDTSNSQKLYNQSPIQVIKRAIEESKKRKVHFITYDNLNEVTKYTNSPIYSYLIRYAKGIILDGCLKDQIIYEVNNISVQEKVIKLNEDEAYFISDKKCKKISKKSLGE